MRVRDVLGWAVPIAIFFGGVAWILQGLRNDDGGKGLSGAGAIALSIVLAAGLLRRRVRWLDRDHGSDH